MNIIWKKVALFVATALVLPMFAASASADDGKAALKFVPKDTMMVISIDVNSLKKTSIFKEMMTAIMQDADAKKNLKMFKEATGFDPEKDLESIVIALPPDVEKTENFLFIAKGKVDEKKFISFAKDQGGKIAEGKAAGQAYYEIDSEAAVAFVGDHIVMGPKVALEASLNTKKGNDKAVTDNSDMSGLIGAVDTKANIWMAVILPDDIRKELAKQDPNAGDITDAHASVDLGSGLKLRLTLGTGASGTADSIVKLAQEGLKSVKSDPNIGAMGLDPVFTGLSVAAAGKKVNVSLDLSQADFDRIVEMVKAMAMGGMR